MACVEAALEALNESKRVLAVVAPAATGMQDARANLLQLRTEWEQKLFVNETQFLRSVADLQGAFQHRASLMEANFRDIARSQHADYLGALERSTLELQKKFWDEVAKARRDDKRGIHAKLPALRHLVLNTA